MVKGEDFLNNREEQECCKLIRESTIFLFKRLDELSDYERDTAGKDLSKHMKKYLKKELDSIKKIFIKVAFTSSIERNVVL